MTLNIAAAASVCRLRTAKQTAEKRCFYREAQALAWTFGGSKKDGLQGLKARVVGLLHVGVKTPTYRWYRFFQQSVWQAGEIVDDLVLLFDRQAVERVAWFTGRSILAKASCTGAKIAKARSGSVSTDCRQAEIWP